MIERRQYLHHFISVLTIFMILGLVIRLVIKRYNLNIPHHLFTIGISIIAGATIANNEELRRAWFLQKMAPQHAVSSYVPIFIVSTIYSMDHQLFKRYVLQATLVTLSTAVITPLVMSAFLTLVLYPEWSYSHGLILSVIILPVEPRYLVELLQVLSNYKFLATMLQTESVLMQVLVVIGHTFLSSYRSGLMDKWYQFAAFICRHIIGGILAGFLAAPIHIRLILLLYHKPVHAVCISVLMVYITYFLCKYVLFVNGAMAVICMCFYLIINKHKLSTEVDNCLQVFWNTFFNLVETPLLMFAMTEVTLYAVLLFDYATMYGAIFLYVVGTLERLRACVMLTPVLSRMSYKVNTKCLFVLGWGGVRGISNLYNLLVLFGLEHLSMNMDSFLLGAMCYVVLTNLINCTTMRVLLNMMGLLSITTTRLADINKYVSYLRAKQLNMLDLLKFNRYLSNTHWVLVRKESFVYDSYLHRASEYHKAVQLNEEHNFKLNDRVMTCPDCHKEFRNELTAKEIEDILKKNLLQILKTQKVTIIKQYESGIINKKVLQTLEHQLDTKIESNKRRNETNINLDKLNQKARWSKILIKLLRPFSNIQEHDPPKNHVRRLCFYLVLHYMYDIIFLTITIGNAVFSLWNNNHCCESTMYWYHFGIWFIFIGDLALNIIAFGKKYLLAKKIKDIWNVKWNMLACIFQILGLVNLFTTNATNVFDWTIYYIPSFRTLSAVRLIAGFSVIENYPQRITAIINYTVDSNIALRFALTTAWLDSIEEILNALPQIVTEKIAREYFEKKLNEERSSLLEKMASMQKTRPWVAVSVKTRQAIRMTLFAIEMNMMDMQGAGYIDAIESAVINKALKEPQKFLTRMKLVQPNAIKIIFHCVPWMPHENEDVMEYLYDNAEEVSRDTDESVMKFDCLAEGVYVVVTGTLILQYQPRISSAGLLNFEGNIPIVDYLSSTDYITSYKKVMVSGNTVGELGVITGRPYDCTIFAGSPSQGYWLPAKVIRTAMKMCNHPVTGLEARIWHHCCENLAVAIFMQAPEYKYSTKEQITTKLKRAFIPILRSYLTFVVTELTEDLLLINGTVVNYESDETYIAPLLIPSIASKLRLVQNVEQKIEVNLLVVPREDVTPVQVMTEEEEIADLRPEQNSDELLMTKIERKMTRLQSI